MKSLAEKLNNITGQIQGINRMIDSGEDCFKVLTQMKAARSALNSVMSQYMGDNFNSCLLSCKKSGEREEVCNKFMSEILK